MLADLYHASVMQDPPADLERYSHLVDTVEIAEAKGRTVPGVNGQDFRPYFDALRAGGFQGPIEIEGKWTFEQVPQAFATIREQSA
jgi:sugar phosphate isomerase/epimerase